MGIEAIFDFSCRSGTDRTKLDPLQRPDIPTPLLEPFKEKYHPVDAGKDKPVIFFKVGDRPVQVLPRLGGGRLLSWGTRRYRHRRASESR